MAHQQERPEVFFYVVERSTSTQALLQDLYLSPSDATRAHFLHVNAHIDPNRVLRGQLVVVTPADPNACTQQETELGALAQAIEAARRARPQNAPDPETFNRHHDLLNFVDAQAAGAVGAFATFHGNRVKHVARILREIEDLYVRTYNAHGRFNVQGFFSQRRMKFEQLDVALGQLLRSRMVDPRYTRMRTALGLSTKSLLNVWGRQGQATHIPGFDAHYRRVGALSRTLRGLGYVGVGLDGYYSYRQVQEACTVDNTSPNCTRRKFTETGRFTGGLALGALGGYAGSYGVCNLILGLPSAGTSLIWCGIFAGAAGATVFGMAGGAAGEQLGEFVYENTYQADSP